MKRFKFILFFITALLVGHSTKSFATSAPKCKYILSARTEVELEYLKLGVDLSELPKEKADYLRSVPPFIFSSSSPSYETLEKADLRGFKDLDIQMNREVGRFATMETFQTVLRLFQQFGSTAEYYFIGNGFYIPYLMAKSLFDNTPMKKQIKFVAFSRPLSKIAEEEPQKFVQYFKSLGVGEHPDKNIVVIDSVSGGNEPTSHSIIRTSNAFRKYLALTGRSERKAIDSVIAYGMPEILRSQSYKVESIPEYQKRMSEIKLEDLGVKDVPYLDVPVRWDQAPFNISYGSDGNLYYWNGKYKELDQKDMPKGVFDLRSVINNERDFNLHRHVEERAARAKFYKRIMMLGEAYRSDLDFKIDEILQKK